MAASKSPWVGRVLGCARCGANHRQLTFRRFRRPAGTASHWSLCPRTREPILMTIREDA